MFLKRRQLLAESGLREMQDIGGPRDAAAIDDSDEGFEASDIHDIRAVVSLPGMFADTDLFCNAGRCRQPLRVAAKVAL
ncbi:conserved hypothetical protein [Ricinus communis]|uniref:Uncharacterized protein n=1 Tax=Ricinus communis TaxID=3988 RepID=B9TK21_RICCO|nr:conserved hypothetical protein [Ricinus communis]